jgi:hypothetical protein
MKSNDAFEEFHMRFQSTDFVLAVVLVLVLVLHPLRNSDFEDEYEKNQIKSHAYAPASAG